MQVEGRDDAVFLLLREQGLLILAFLDDSAEFGCIHQNDIALGVGFVQKQDRDVRAGGGEDVAGHRDHATQHAPLYQFLADLAFDATLGGEEAGRDNDRRFTLGRERIDDVLDEDQVDRHLIFLIGDVGNAREEALVVGFGVEVVAKVAEIQFEGRVRDNVIEGFETVAIAVVGRE